MADIKRLLNKKGWTGRELGILELTNMCVMFRQALEGKEPRPIVEPAQLRRMINTITDRQQGQVYNGYIAIHEWLTVRYNIAQSHYQQAQLQYRTLEGYIERAILAEDIYRYIEDLPAIMTQAQYDAIRAERIEAQFKDGNGEELYTNVFNLVEQAINYYLHKLQREPGKPNPLKAIRKKYINQPVKSKYILSRWNEVTGDGYYTIEDGSGRRSDQMTDAEWQKAITTPTMQEALDAMETPDGSGRALADALATMRVTERNRVIYNGGTYADAEKAQREREYNLGLAVPVKWHTKEEPPAELTKWDVIEQDVLLKLYPAKLDVSGNEYSESNFTRSMEDFVAEFRELVTAILKDIDKSFFKGEPGLSVLPVSEWGTTLFSNRELYEKDFYGKRATVESDTSIFEGERRAIYNGIAIIRANDLLDRSPRIDERGFYVEPEIKSTLSPYTLEGFFTDAEEYADNVDIVESSRQMLFESYYHLKGYNYALELIGKYYDVPELTVFQMDVEDIEERIQALNDLVPSLYSKIYAIQYGDSQLKAKKLQVLKDFFQPLDYKVLNIPEENKLEAHKLLEGFRAFQQEGIEQLNRLLCVLPQTDEDGEGAN